MGWALIRVFESDGGWTWAMVCAAGRVLVYTADRWPTDLLAFDAARRYRTAFWAMASQIDHRMGACI